MHVCGRWSISAGRAKLPGTNVVEFTLLPRFDDLVRGVLVVWLGFWVALTRW